jgi:hypothetical protein
MGQLTRLKQNDHPKARKLVFRYSHPSTTLAAPRKCAGRFVGSDSAGLGDWSCPVNVPELHLQPLEPLDRWFLRGRGSIMIVGKVFLRRESAVVRTLRFGVMAAVLIHTLCGCCLHHAHAETGSQASPEVVPAACSHCHCDGHGRGDGEPHQNTPGDDSCDGTDCTFVRPDDSSGHDGNPAADAALLLVPTPSVTAASAPAHRDCGAGFFPRLRLHLLIQVLLV